MTIKQGFLFLFLGISGWISLCYLTEAAFPKKPVRELMYWYGEIHFGIPEFVVPDEISPDDLPERPKADTPEDKGAE